MVDGAPHQAGEDRPRVFVSYSRKDQEFVGVLTEALAREGFLADFDNATHDPNRIESGISAEDEWWVRLQGMIAAAEVIVFVVSPDSAASKTCDEEIAYARLVGKRIIPILLKPINFQTAPPRLAALNVKIDFSREDAFPSAFEELRGALLLDVAWHREGARLSARANRWSQNDRRADELLQGAEVGEAESWIGQRPASAPPPGELITDYIQMSRAEEEAERASALAGIKRTRRLQAFIGAAIAASAFIVVIAGAAAANLISNLGAQRAEVLADLAARASDEGRHDRAARYARAALSYSDWPLIGFEARAAETELRRALIGLRLEGAVTLPRNAYSVRWLEDGRVVAFGSGGAFFVDPNTARAVEVDVDTGGRSFSQALSANGRRTIIAPFDGPAFLADALSGQVLAELPQSGQSRSFFNRDGTRLISRHAGGFEMRDAETGRALASGAHQHASFSDDGRIVAAAEAQIALFLSSETGRFINRLSAEAPIIGDFSFSERGTHVAFETAGGRIEVWNRETGRRLARIATGETHGGFSLNPSGTHLLAWRTPGAIAVYRTSDGQRAGLFSLGGHNPEQFHFITDVFVSLTMIDENGQPTERTLAVTDEGLTETNFEVLANSDDGGSLLIRSADGVFIANEGQDFMPQLSTDPSRAWFSPEGRRLLVARVGGALELYAVDTGEKLATLSGHQRTVVGIAFNDARLASVAEDQSVRIWRLDRDTVAALGESAAETALFLDDGQSGFIASDGEATLWALSPAPSNSQSVGADIVSLSRSGHVAGRRDGVIEVREARGGALVVRASGEYGQLSETGARLIVARANDLDVWEMETRARTQTISGVGGEFLLSPNGRYLAVRTGMGGSMAVWDLVTRQRTRAISPAQNADAPDMFEEIGWPAAFSPDGSQLAIAYRSEEISLYDVAQERAPTTLSAISVSDLMFDRSGTRLAAININGPPIIWDAASGTELARLAFRGDLIIDAENKSSAEIGLFAGSPYFITHGEDGALRLWDIESARELAALYQSEGSLTSLDLSSNGESVLIAGDDRPPVMILLPQRILALSRRQLMVEACSALKGDLSNVVGAEFEEARVLDRRLDQNVCQSRSLFTQLSAYFDAR